jgi:O-antigen/teichoic acid export membrane protein
MSKGKGEAVMGGMRWLAIGKLVSMAISFVTTAVLARLLTPYDFGVMAVVLLVIALSNAIFEGAFGMGVTIKKDIDDDYIATTFWLSVILSAILVGALWVASPWLEQFFRMPHLADIIRFTSTSLIFNAASNVSYSLMRRSGPSMHRAAPPAGLRTFAA